MSRPDAPGEANGPAGEAAAPGARRVAQAVGELIRLIPEGSNRAILAALVLVGLLFWEHLYVQAPQQVPLA